VGVLPRAEVLFRIEAEDDHVLAVLRPSGWRDDGHDAMARVPSSDSYELVQPGLESLLLAGSHPPGNQNRDWSHSNQ